MKTKSSAANFPHLIIRASAGTGKTFQLSNRFIGLLNDNVSGDSILATTFTRKAAGEILDRVLVRLAKGALDDRAAAELGEHVRDENLSRERCLTLISQATKNLHRLHIGTLDSFFAQLARSFGLELGLPPGWEIVDETEDARLRREAVAAVLRQQEAGDLKTLMNHLTKGESARGVAELIHTTVAALYGLFQETKREAWEKLPRSSHLTDEQLQSTLQALSAATLPKKQMQTTRDSDVQIAARGDWQAFISKGLTAKVLDGSRQFNRTDIPADVVSLYEKLLSQARAVLVGKLVLQTESTYELLARFDAQYQRLKRERRALRFEDVTRQLAEVSLMDDVGRLAFRLDAHVDQLLLDEFQDTSPPQWRVLRPFAQRITGEAKRRSFFCVGDVKQAIYGWRGGVAEIFDSVASELSGLEESPLNVSYRSAQPIIETVNQVFSRLDRHTNLDREQKGAALWAKRFANHSTTKTGLTGYVCLETAALAEEGEDKKQARLAYAARRIAEIVQEAPGRQVGVLLRSNSGVAGLVFELRSLGVHASEEGGNPLTDSAAVQIILSLLRLADHPGDRVARFHVEHSPLGEMFGREEKVQGSGFRVQEEEKCEHPTLNIERPTSKVSDDSTRTPTSSQTPHHDPSRRAGIPGRGRNPSGDQPPATSPPGTLDSLRVSQLVRRSLAADGYGPTLRRWAEILTPSCNRRELARLVQLVELAYGYDARATLRADDFVEFVGQQKVADPTAANVRVMTVHQAKGLEFEIVVLPQLEGSIIGQSESFVVQRPDPAGPVERICRYAGKDLRALLPDDVNAMFDAADDRDVTESLCVLYVALTRAARALYMIIPASNENERTLPKTFAGLLRAALHNTDPVPEKSKLVELGNPLWHTGPDPGANHCVGNALRGVPDPARDAPEKAVIFPGMAGSHTAAPERHGGRSLQKDSVPLVVSLAPNAAHRTRGLERESPSGLEGGSHVRLSVVFTKRENQFALDQGTLIHALFEQVVWLDDGPPADDTLRAAAERALDACPLATVGFDRALATFRTMLARPPIAHAISRAAYSDPQALGLPVDVEREWQSGGRRLVVHNERTFALRREENKLLQGSIDRLVLLYAGQKLVAADILDYKTDTVPPGDSAALSAKIEHYRPQLDAYRAAVSQLFKLAETRVTARLLFVGAGIVAPVTHG